MFLQKYNDTNFSFGGQKIWKEGVLVTHLSSNVGISVYRLGEFRQIAI
jgi:hypothetical protein